MRLARQRVEMQRHRDQHALPEIADGRHEDRPPLQPRIDLQLRQVLVLEAEPVKLEGRRGAGLIGLDHALAAAGIARDGVDGDRMVRRDQPGIDERAQQRDAAGRVAARIRDAVGIGDLLGMAGLEFGEAIDPARRDAMGGRGIDDLGRSRSRARRRARPIPWPHRRAGRARRDRPRPSCPCGRPDPCASRGRCS